MEAMILRSHSVLITSAKVLSHQGSRSSFLAVNEVN